LCGEILPKKIETKLILITQWAEWWRASNTGRLVKLMIPETTILLRGDPGALPMKAYDISDFENPVLLFPGANAFSLTHEYAASLNRPITLFVPDGTWREAGRVVRRTPFLRGVSKTQLINLPPSRYRLRKKGRVGTVSTLESVAYVLEVLEGREIAESLMRLFDKFVEIRFRKRQRAPSIPVGT
jgi:DTW domain-containing protein YfiP